MNKVLIKSKDAEFFIDVPIKKAKNVQPIPQAQSAQVIDCIGVYPLRMLVAMVKLIKAVEYKRQVVKELTELNDMGEHLEINEENCPSEFRERYSKILRELDIASKLVTAYSDVMNKYNGFLRGLSKKQT